MPRKKIKSLVECANHGHPSLQVINGNFVMGSDPTAAMWKRIESKAKAVIATVANNDDTRLRLEMDFVAFEARFRQHATGEVSCIVAAFFESLRERGLVSSTLVTYTKAFLPYFKKRWPNESMEKFHKYIAGLKLEVMSSHVRHAPDIDIDCAFEIINTTKVLGIKIDLWLMAVTGGRYADLRRCKQICMLHENGFLFVQWGPMKNRRNAMQQVSNSYWIPPQLAKFDFIADLPTMSTPSHERKTTHSSYSSISARLKLFQLPQRLVKPEVQYEHVTSYSFRRMFIQNAIDVNTNEKGFIDWEAVCQMTNHKTGAVINATYKKNPTHPTITGSELNRSNTDLANKILLEMSEDAANDLDEGLEDEIPELDPDEKNQST